MFTILALFCTAVVDGSQDIGEVAGAIGLESLQWEELRLWSNQVNHTHNHGAVAKGGVLDVGVENCRGLLIEDCGALLIHDGGESKSSLNTW